MVSVRTSVAQPRKVTVQTPPALADVITATIDGELDLATAPYVAEYLRGLLERGSRVVLDMSAVTFMDCAGLSELEQAHRRAAQDGGWVHLTGVSAGPMRVLRLTRNRELRVLTP